MVSPHSGARAGLPHHSLYAHSSLVTDEVVRVQETLWLGYTLHGALGMRVATPNDSPKGPAV